MITECFLRQHSGYASSVGGNKKEKTTPMEKEESSILDTSSLHLDISIT